MARRPVTQPQMPVDAPSGTGDANAPVEERTLGDMLGLQAIPEEPQARPGLMSDDPYEVPPGFKPIPSADFAPPQQAIPRAPEWQPPGQPAFRMEPQAAPFPTDDRPHLRPAPEILPPGQRWETRIEVVEAYQYPGNLLMAPEWIDRSWIGYADLDPLRGIPPGPCLRVPREGTSENWVVRVGDYVVRQEVKFPDRPSILRTEVWPREGFEAYFMPVRPATLADDFTSTQRPTGPLVELSSSASAGSA